MQDKFGGKGLTVIGVTSEGKSETEPWVAKKGAKYAYAYDKGGALARYFGVKGIPAAVLIDATGTVVWSGHPSSLEESVIEKSTSGALSKPLWEWTGAAKGVKTALMKRDYKAALDGAAKLGAGDDGPAILAALQAMVKNRVEGMKAAYAEGNFYGAESEASALSKELAGLPEKPDADQVLADLKANKDAAPILKAQRQIAKIREAGLTKSKEIDAAIDDLKKIGKELPSTYAATEASALITQLQATKSRNK